MVSACSNSASPVYFGLGGVCSPAIVVVAVDVQDLLALDTEHTVLRGVSSVCGSRQRPAGPGQAWELFTQREYIRSDLSPSHHCQFRDTTPKNPRPGRFAAGDGFRRGHGSEGTPHCGVGNANDMDIPVPSTMTSYSLAISSMFAVASGSGRWDIMAVRVQHCLVSRVKFRGLKRCGRAVSKPKGKVEAGQVNNRRVGVFWLSCPGPQPTCIERDWSSIAELSSTRFP